MKHTGGKYTHSSDGKYGIGYAHALSKLQRLNLESESIEMKRAASSSLESPVEKQSKYERWSADTALERDVKNINTLSMTAKSAYDRTYQMGLQAYNTGKMDPGSKSSGEELTKFWINHYDKDRRKRRLVRDTQDEAARAFYDEVRPDTPLRERPVANSKGLLDLSREEYVNFRRGYEASVVRFINAIKAKPGALFPIHPSKMVDRLKPGKRWANPVFPDDLKAHPEVYHEVFPDNLYILRVDVPSNYPSVEQLKTEDDAYDAEVSQMIIDEVDEEDDGIPSGEFLGNDGNEGSEGSEDDSDDLRDDIPDGIDETSAGYKEKEREEREEEERNFQLARKEYLGVAQNGLVLNDSHLVLPLYPNHAESFYTSMSILMQERGKSVDSPDGSSKSPTASNLREEAMRWFSRTNPDPIERQYKLITATDATFVSYLQGFVPRGASTMQMDYTFGMPRTMAMINNDRKNQTPSLSEFTSWSTSVYQVAPNESRSLMTQYADFQARTTSWPTMYDVEALAFAIDSEIHLYFTSGNQGSEPSTFALDWNKIKNPIRLGPLANAATPVRDPYRLLWSGNHQMHFRPLISKGINQSFDTFAPAQRLRNQYATNRCITVSIDHPLNRNDRDSKGLHPQYYEDNVWNGEYDVDA